ncbi:hypothetical protein [Tenacibaculum geojense]|uniref:SH3b domain-containing protein n=1 Tax=Tenacibaculum geojense TaxID=915352 RepID=A0ABW3JV31_9FLAO
MRVILSIIILLSITNNCFSQEKLKSQIEIIEKNIKVNSISDFEKLQTDLDNDNDLDYIYLYQCGEPKCIEVYLNVNNKLKKVINEPCYNYYLYNGDIKHLTLKLNHCCGESPFTSNRVFNFKFDKVITIENYVLFNESYELLKPDNYLLSVYNVKILNNNYNVRFSPNIKEYDEDESMFSCEPNTNIIGRLKENSTVKVLSELIKETRIWLYVEIESNSLNHQLCNNPIDYEFKGQKLRGWISNNFVEKTIN